MITPYKGRELNYRDKVEIYLNLQKGNVFSIRNAKTGLVVAHGDDFVVNNGEAVVSEAGRQRVLESGVKSVHAIIRGVYMGEAKDWIIEGKEDDFYELYEEIYYSPFKTSQFIHKETGKAVTKEDFLFKDSKAYILNVEPNEE